MRLVSHCMALHPLFLNEGEIHAFTKPFAQNPFEVVFVSGKNASLNGGEGLKDPYSCLVDYSDWQ